MRQRTHAHTHYQVHCFLLIKFQIKIRKNVSSTLANIILWIKIVEINLIIVYPINRIVLTFDSV